MNVLGTAGFTIALMTLGLAAYSHALNLPAFVRVIKGHRLAPPTLALPLAAGVLTAEIILPLIGMVGFLAAPDLRTMAVRASAVSAFLLYVAFAAYSALLLRRGRGAPCGCGGTSTPVSTATVVRAAVLALAVAWAIWQPLSIGFVGASATDVVLLLLSAAVFAELLWIAPSISELLRGVTSSVPNRGGNQ